MISSPNEEFFSYITEVSPNPVKVKFIYVFIDEGVKSIFKGKSPMCSETPADRVIGV